MENFNQNYYGYIYLILDTKYNKIYIGQKKGKIEDSLDYFGSGTIIRRIIKARGTYLLKKKILKICYSKEELNKSEIEFIKMYKSQDFNYGYNITKGGIGGYPIGEYNGMYKKSVQKRWEELYGKDKAKELWDLKRSKTSETFKNKTEEEKQKIAKKMSRPRESNGHYGKTTFDLQLEKYGEEIALIKRQEGIDKRLKTMNDWDDSKKKEFKDKLSLGQKNVNNIIKFEKYKETVNKRTPEKELEIYKNRSNACSGSKNGRAITIKFISPKGEYFIVKGGFKKFCKEHSLNEHAMYKVRKGLRDNYQNWRCYLVNE